MSDGIEVVNGIWISWHDEDSAWFIANADGVEIETRRFTQHEDAELYVQIWYPGGKDAEVPA